MLVNAGARSHLHMNSSTSSTVPWAAPSLRGHRDLAKSRNGSQTVFKLPVEILCDIFLKTLADGNRISPDEEHRPGLLVSLYCAFNPAVLTQICSSWRSIALKFPALWSRMYIKGTSTCRVRPLKTWLLRSKGSPLHIRMQAPISRRMEVSYQILSLVFAYSSCWRSIEFNIALWSVRPMLQLVRSSEPCNALESAIYIIPELQMEPRCPIPLMQPIQEIAAFFHASPVLQNTTWHHEVVCLPTRTFSRLGSLDIWFPIAAETLLRILVEIPNLQSLQVRKLELPFPANIPLPGPVVLPKLQDLKIRTDLQLDPFFCNVTFPSLRNLEITYQGFDRPFGPLVFHNFFCRSACTLDRLKLCGKGPEDCLEEILISPALRKLTTLHVKWKSVTDQVIGLLIRDRSHNLMPRLSSLYLDKCRPGDGMLSALLSSRWYTLLDGSMCAPGHLRHALILCMRGGLGPLDSAFLMRHADEVNMNCVESR